MPFLPNQASSSRPRKNIDVLSRVLSNDKPSSNKPNMPSAAVTGGAPLGRKVHTMPPSAIFDPPTPPLPPHNPLPDTKTLATPKRPRPIRYSDSGSDADDSSEDELPPFWLFTSMGMAKMRERTMRRKRDDTEESAPESEDGRKGRRRFVPSRKSSRNSDEPKRKGSPVKSSPLTLGPILPVRSQSHFPDLKWRRSTPDEVQSDSDIPRRAFKRSNSAPDTAHPLSSIITAAPVVSEPIAIADVGRSKRQMTAPSFPRLRRLRTDHRSGHVSDSDLPPPKLKVHRPTSFPSRNDSDPPRPRRLNTNLLKVQLEPISQHFAHGWPHAGSWQDALNGTYEDGPGEPGLRPAKRKDSARDREVSAETLVAQPRRRTRRRRYRQALAPPTPKGLGFSPSEEAAGWKEGRVNKTEFDWTQPTTSNPSHWAPQPTGSTIPEGDELSRVQTRQIEEKPKRLGRITEGEDWKVRLKRMMFLDARLTIFLRVMDIAVVATLLGEPKFDSAKLGITISIRQELYTLRLPGLVGPSTTLMIAFASFTLLHAVTAIYREYFGKPIGLWGLRSKMLWVCLDLLFVGLWSSALSLATNDYISTPLMCTRDDPWWIAGLRQSYASLLAEMATPNATSADVIKATLGIILPEQIVQAPLAREICRRQSSTIALSLIVLLLYAGNMVLSLFRIFETVRRSANVGRAFMV